MEGSPPFLITDGFPADYLPKPLFADFNIDDPEERKEQKKIDFISLEDFNHVRKGDKYKLKIQEDRITTSVTTHNTINRLTNTTPAEGGVYSLEETFIPYITIFVKTISEDWKNRVVEILRSLSRGGYGRKKSIGKGQFSLADVNDFSFEPVENPDGFVTLSNFCPAENDPIDGLYKTFVKYGKLGEELTFCGNPFKKPLVMIKNGSVFKTNSLPKPFYGRMVEGIAPAKPEVVQYGYSFAVPIKIGDL